MIGIDRGIHAWRAFSFRTVEGTKRPLTPFAEPLLNVLEEFDTYVVPPWAKIAKDVQEHEKWKIAFHFEEIG